MKMREQLPKMMVLGIIVLIYIVTCVLLIKLVDSGIIPREPAKVIAVDNSTDVEVQPSPLRPIVSLDAAIHYVNTDLRKPNGHIDLYKAIDPGQNISDADFTNSEAVSYYLQIAAQSGNKTAFDDELAYMQTYMVHPTGGYLMWKLNGNDLPDGDGGKNIAPDADLRALRALFIAKDLWGDPRYDVAIDQIASGLEKVALTPDGTIVAYAGLSGTKAWQADESYLSYADYQSIDRLANTRGGIWLKTAQRMRNITLGAQIWNGLYNTEYFMGRPSPYGSGLDAGGYSINSLWIMTRFAESGDPVLMNSSRKALDFYQQKYAKDGKIFAAYKSNGDPAVDYEAPWAYALVARTAYALNDKAFGQLIVRSMLVYQDLDNESSTYGAIIEGTQGNGRVGQFTMQESILTLQETQGRAPKFNT